MTGPVDLGQHTRQTFTHVIGVDEVGWGAIAGPLVVAATVFECNFTHEGLKDSKRFTTRRSRIRGAELAKQFAIMYETCVVSPESIYADGPRKCLERAQHRVVKALLEHYPDALIVVDGKYPISGLPKEQQVALPSADARVPAASAASIIAKVQRDMLMEGYAELYPEWNFHKNKGYPTQDHRAMVESWGPTYIHRRNIKLVQEAYNSKGWYNAEEDA